MVEAHVVESASDIFDFFFGEQGESGERETFLLASVRDEIFHYSRIVAFFAEDRVGIPSKL